MKQRACAASLRGPTRGKGSGLGDCRNRYAQSGDAYGQLCSLTGGRVDREPLDPFLIHSSEVGFLGQNDGRAHDVTVALTMFAIDVPAATRIAEMFVRHCAVCSWMLLPRT